MPTAQPRTATPAEPPGSAPWPAGTVTVRAGHAPGTVVRCALPDLLLAELPVSTVLFFDGPVDPARLAESLARALERLPVFAGRLRATDGGGLDIHCTDAGVPFSVADEPLTLAGALDRIALPSSGLVDHVAASAAHTADLPLLTVRLTRLPDGASVLGLSWHHAVGDLRSFATLLRTWSALDAGRPAPDVLIAADREAQLDRVLPAEDCGRPGIRLPDADEALALRREIETAALANRTVRIYFSAAEVTALRAAFGTAAGRRLSANDTLCGHLLDTLRQVDPGGFHLTVPVDVRRHLGLPAGTVGNLLGEIHLPFAADAEPAAFAARLRTAVEEFRTEHLNLRANLAFLESVGRERARACVPSGFDPARRTLSFSSWCRLGLGELPFAGRRPLLLAPAATLQLPWTSWLVEGPGGEGLLYTLVLPGRPAQRLRSPQAREALHRHRQPGEPLPALVTEARKLL